MYAIRTTLQAYMYINDTNTCFAVTQPHRQSAGKSCYRMLQTVRGHSIDTRQGSQTTPYLKGMHDKIIHVVIMHQKVAKLLGQHLLDTVLLCADEALYHHTAEQNIRSDICLVQS